MPENACYQTIMFLHFGLDPIFDIISQKVHYKFLVEYYLMAKIIVH